MKVKPYIVESIFIPVVLLLMSLAVFAHWSLGVSIFQYAIIQEPGSFLQNLFAAGYIEGNAWWYGLGHTSWMLIKVPVLAYVLIRLILTLSGLRFKRNTVSMGKSEQHQLAECPVRCGEPQTA